MPSSGATRRSICEQISFGTRPVGGRCLMYQAPVGFTSGRKGKPRLRGTGPRTV